jgi:3-hydroxyisobutyrate dehydrogenase
MQPVGFIGVGMMGGPIAGRLLRSGIPVLAFDTNPAALRRIEEQGAAAAASVREVADQAEVVFACLPTPEICRAVASGEGGVAGGRKVRIYVETSTLGGSEAAAMAAALAPVGITLLDCPVVGGAVALEKGTLGVLVSGPRAAFERAAPALEAFAGRLFYLGEKAGSAQAAKVMSNSVTYATFLATCEAVATGMRAGLDMETAVAIINQGSGANFFSRHVFPDFILKGRFDGTGAMEIGVKDVKLFLAEAARLGVDPPVARFVSAMQERILAAGPPGRDTLTAFHYFEDLARGRG